LIIFSNDIPISQKCDFGFIENRSISPEASVATAYQLTTSAATSVKKM